MQNLELNKFVAQETLNQKPLKRNLEDFSLTVSGIPEVLYSMTNFFDLNESFYRSKGIFRVSGSMEEENELKERLEQNDYEAIIECQDPNIVANLIKRYFRDLLNPLMPFNFYKNFTELVNKYPEPE